MTVPMWFAWMLRGDIRGDLAVDDPEGQRDFVCWWLCFGRAEYPATWSAGPAQVALAQAIQPATGQPPAALTRLLAYLVRCRTDLAAVYAPHGIIDTAGLLCWYRVSGPSELSFAPPLPPALMAFTEQACTDPPWARTPTPVPRIAAELWRRSDALQALWPADAQDTGRGLADWYHGTGWRLLPQPGAAPAPPRALQRPALAPADAGAGVNLVGYPRAELGIGEDVRMLSAALETAGVPHAILDVPFGPAARRADDSVAARITSRLDHPITIFCLTAFDTADLYLRQGGRSFSGTHRIGNWPWELPRFPRPWLDTFDLVDEIWAASRYAMQSYESAGRRTPIRLMPPAVAIGPVSRTGWRRQLPNPRAFTFLVPFDPYSSFRRKNPAAAVHAFRRAFPLDDPTVALVLRINGDPAGQPGWAELQHAAAGDPRIRLWTRTLDRAEALGLVRDADCLVSAHRAEGFGRNIAEAKMIGTPVLATGFSGNMDFTAPEEAIGWQPVPLAPGEYPHADGLWWAEPSIEHLARRMQEVRAAPVPRRSAAAIRAASGRKLREVGAAYAARIAEITSMLRARSTPRRVPRRPALPPG